MKKILSLLLLLTCVSLSAQTIAFRQEKGDAVGVGTNFMTTSLYLSPNTGTSLAIFSSKSTGAKEIYLGLYFETKSDAVYTQEHSKAIFKTFSGKLITLQQVDSTDDCIFNRKYKSTTTSSGTSIVHYYMKVNYRISMEDALTLMEEGVALLRIETSAGLRDYTYNKDYLGGFILSEYLLIKDKQSFESNF